MLARAARCVLTFSLAATAATAVAVVGASPAWAAGPFAVTTTADVVNGGDGVLSLREAINAAAADGTETIVQLAAGSTYQLTICADDGADEDLNADGDLDHLEAFQLTIQGNGSTIRNTCVNERVIETGNAFLTLQSVVITGGDIDALPDNGGAVRATGNVETFDSEIRDNSAATGGGIFSDATVSLSRTAITGNTATSVAGGIAATDVINVAASTISGNTALSAAALEATDIILDFSTIAGNTTSGAGNSDIESDTFESEASSVGDSLGLGSACGISITLTSFGENADDDGTCGFTQPTDHPNVPSLGLLALGGTAPRYRLPAIGSVLFNAIPLGECPSDEQRLVPRGQGGLCEIGAVEVRVPIANDDTAVAAGPTTLAVRANDTDPDSRVTAGSMTIPTAPTRGTATVQGDFTILYTPNLGYAGPDALIYRLCGAGETQCQTATVSLTVVATSRFVPLSPARVFDTRPGETAPGPKGFVAAGGSIDVQVTGVGEIPATGVSAVVLNVTATEAGAAGFVTAWPTGQARPNTSNLNLIQPGQTAPNLVTVPVGAGGKVSFFTQSGAHLLADIAGYYTGAVSATAGRLVPLTPVRIFDSRPGTSEPGPKGFVGAGATVAVAVAGVGPVPATGVSAVVLNVTGTEAAADGFVTAWPGGTARPTASNLNLSAGQTAPNLVTVRVGADGRVNLFSQTGAHLIADVTGYYTDATAPSSGAGLFVPLTPGRVSDTRAGTTDPGPKGLVGEGASIDVQVTGAASIPAGAAAAVLNLTATEAVGAGFVTGWPTGSGRPNASNLNLNVAGETRPNAAILRLGNGGRISLFSQTGTHLVVDASGYFTG